jgi:hypothetical protein
MFARKTLFVVGAGASAEFGLPVGSGVADIIAQKLSFRLDEFHRVIAGSGDPQLFNLIRNQAGQERMQQYFDACKLITSGIILADSIDRFIDYYRNDEAIRFCGKLALAQTILEAERGSALAVDPGNIYNTIDFRTSKNTWLRHLISLCFGGFERTETRIYENVSFVTFNYDRCIEQYLFWALRGLGLPEREAAKITGKVQIIHPYGSLGRLPWQTHEASIVEFGAKEGVDLPTVASGIRTYHEEIVDLTRQAVIEELFAAAETLVFLGFAYHDQNLALLRPKTQGRTGAFSRPQWDLSLPTYQTYKACFRRRFRI